MNRLDTHWLVTLLGLALAALIPGAAVADLKPLKEHIYTNDAVVSYLSQAHYLRVPINNALSSRMFDRYVKNLDAARIYFTESDIAEFEAYRYTLDEALKRGDLKPAFAMFNRYQTRLIERLEYVSNLVDQGINTLDFSIDETLLIERKDVDWARDREALDNLWRKRLKNDVLVLKLAAKKPKEISKLLKARFRSRLSHARKITSEDAFQTYINAFAQTYDPHTEYFSPLGSENFNINMSLSLEGIGAVLQSDNEYTKVVRLVPAGPADKSKLLRPTDRIVAVGQGKDGEMVDIIGWRLDDVVQLIRGPKRSLVKLGVIRGDVSSGESPRIISITRDTVKLEEQSAQKQTFELKRGDKSYKLGVITVPTFYLDFKAMQNKAPNYKSTTRDVNRLVSELTKSGIDGLLIDLRNNSGGSLQEANSLLGLFIDKGPTVQIRDSEGKIEVLDDPHPGVVYAGPLAVMVNRLSASASEIFAGAIQDYRRGIIIGSRTFGKGTVQSLYPLKHGQLKLTQGKFYRISGASTQHHGVMPDIMYPPIYDHDDVGESALKNALKWDTVGGVKFATYYQMDPMRDLLRKAHYQRIAQNPDFTFLVDRLAFFKEMQAIKRVSLNENTRKLANRERDQRRLGLENKRRLAKGEKALKKLSDLDEDHAGKADTTVKKVDSLMKEGGQILIDFVTLTDKRLAASGKSAGS
ncbi:MAG TPA: tail-specific protease [Acidiferrobacteraceae bacterium]|nr:tail-specific protease [Acidiferrobacteraceae bacterium]